MHTASTSSSSQNVDWKLHNQELSFLTFFLVEQFCYYRNPLTNTIRALACKQALRDAQVLGREKEGGLATTSLEFEYLHRKSQCEMLIGGDDVTLGTCFSIFVFIRACFCFTLIGRNLTAQSTGSHGGIGGGIQIPTT